MKRFLPAIILVLFLFSSFSVFAQPATPTTVPPAGATATPTPLPAGAATPTAAPAAAGTTDVQATPGCIGGPNDPWRCDEEVTFMGKASSRAKDFLNWTMAHYRWAEWKEDNPIGIFWARIRNIMYGLLFIFVLATAFILIVTRGKSITVMKFIPRFIFILIFATLSFAIVQFLYQISDIVMGFFLQGPGLKPETINKDLKVISGDNLFYIGWDYQTFIGYRAADSMKNGESAFMSILLLKLTSITFYIMAGLLLIRKVILWLFIAVSPVFPFLLLYYPIRNTGKIWIGEFFRWLLYGPLFAIFLYGLVAMWQFQPAGAPPNAVGIPLNFDTSKAGKKEFEKYPTAINIVIGGPGQTISRENNVNLPDTFVLYVFALIMVWVVTFFPFVLLRIFLDHLNNMMGNDNWVTKQLGKTPFGRPPQPPVKPVMPAGPIIPQPPLSPQGAPTGMAKQMPMGAAMRPQDSQVNQQILKTANLSVPTLRDIARMETASMSSSTSGSQSITKTQTQQSLEKIANPAATTNSMERSQFTMVREKLTQESQSGNLFAKSILNAANTMNVASMPQQRVSEVIHKVANPTITSTPAEKQQYSALHEKVMDASKKGDSLAQSILDSTASASQLEQASKRGDSVAAAVLDAIEQQSLQQAKLPTVNRVQAVSLDDYEAVKKMWKENYQKLEAPLGMDRTAWISKDQQKISETINLLSSSDAEKEKQGMQMVSNILPFLMIGGFSKTEVIAYLKAKQEAGKDVLELAKAKEEDEESKVGAGEGKKEQNTMTMEAHEEPEVNPAVSGLKEPLKELEDTPKAPGDAK